MRRSMKRRSHRTSLCVKPGFQLTSWTPRLSEQRFRWSPSHTPRPRRWSRCRGVRLCWIALRRLYTWCVGRLRQDSAWRHTWALTRRHSGVEPCQEEHWPRVRLEFHGRQQSGNSRRSRSEVAARECKASDGAWGWDFQGCCRWPLQWRSPQVVPVPSMAQQVLALHVGRFQCWYRSSAGVEWIAHGAWLWPAVGWHMEPSGRYFEDGCR